MENTNKPIRLLKLKTLPNSNEHYTHPYKQGEVVQYLGPIDKKDGQPETYRKQFVKIFRTKTKEHRVEFKKDFEPIGKWTFDEYDN